VQDSGMPVAVCAGNDQLRVPNEHCSSEAVEGACVAPAPPFLSFLNV
jgi:hypothetical protein